MYFLPMFINSVHILVKGLVQGIGFRPFIYTTALRHHLLGYVRNNSDAVEIVIQGDEENVKRFFRSVMENPPGLAHIESWEATESRDPPIDGFQILDSSDTTGAVTEVSPDIAVCEHCRNDMHHQPHRVGYPLTNCTLCGPRFSIIKSVPYDRESTTMAPFGMCETCRREYENPLDRRFHAQPVACNACGPSYSLKNNNGLVITGREAVVNETVRLLEAGAVVAIKGTGGFHLACDPFNADAVGRLRQGKQRDGKPFALMFRDLTVLSEYAEIDEAEATLLQSIIRPIVLLSVKTAMPPGVSNHLPTIGAMLPSMPFHHLLFERLKLSALVMTSGNISEEPIVIDNSAAYSVFSGFTNAVVTYDRDIYNRVDDSVCAVFGGNVQIIRRSRGFAPSPVKLAFDVEGIAAVGAELKCCFALGKGNKAILSQHIGDLKNPQTLQFYEESWERLCCLFRVKPVRIAHDLHPDYLSTRFALQAGLPTVAVQHHHAHVASCCAEHGVADKVIGVAMDGTGYGPDGAIWGGEFLIADLCNFERFAHLNYVGMPGGDRAAREPWRMAASYLREAYGGDSYIEKCRDLMPELSLERLELIDTSISKRINCPPTSSAGRLFDAVAALCGHATGQIFEAEAAMRLEALCDDPRSVQPYDWDCEPTIDLRASIRQLCADLATGVSLRAISTRFHATIIDIIVNVCGKARESTGLETVVLSGGCFQNRCIFTGTIERLTKKKFTVLTHHQVPCNDGGIPLGQLAVAAHALAAHNNEQRSS